MSLGEVHKTIKGFSVISFDDENKMPCSLQQSSAIGAYSDSVSKPGSSFVWLGREDCRMHLNREQVRDLIDQLQAWLDTGDFK